MSALIKSGKPRQLLFNMIEKNVRLVLSRGILEEFLEVVEDPRIRKYVDEDDVIAFLRVIGHMSTMIRVRSRFKGVKEDPNDDIVLRTAYDGKAEYIVSGDKHLLGLREFRKIKVVTINHMIDILERVNLHSSF